MVYLYWHKDGHIDHGIDSPEISLYICDRVNINDIWGGEKQIIW